jgi:phosphoribosylformimino-5-aminoimidazole carboxamide ribonucleotide (ProFAR) isomerase
MIIPVMPVRMRKENIMTSHMTFSGASIAMDENCVGYNDLLASLKDVCDKNASILAVDADGMRKRDIVPELVRKMRSKRELWFMTGIRNTGDVMDAFNGDMNKLVVPYHFTTDALLKEITELSDSCIPALFAERGDVHTRGKKKDVRNCIRTLKDMNFRKIIVFDVSDGGTWDGIRNLSDTVIPYAHSVDDTVTLRKLGYDDVLVSALKLFRNASERSEIGNCMVP